MAYHTDSPAAKAIKDAAENALVDTLLSCGRLYQRGLVTRYEVYTEAIEAFTKWMTAQESAARENECTK